MAGAGDTIRPGHPHDDGRKDDEMVDPFRVSQTNTKRWVAHCGYQGPNQPEPCTWMSDSIGQREIASHRLRTHVRGDHGASLDDLFQRSQAMKQPDSELPEIGEKLGEYADHLMVFASAKAGTRDTSFGKRDTIECLAYAFVDGAWKALGETPIFWATVKKQVAEAGEEPIGGVLIQGTERNDREWFLAPVPKSDKAFTQALKDWDKNMGGDF